MTQIKRDDHRFFFVMLSEASLKAFGRFFASLAMTNCPFGHSDGRREEESPARAGRSFVSLRMTGHDNRHHRMGFPQEMGTQNEKYMLAKPFLQSV